METSCLRCKKKKTENLNPKIFKTRNGRMIMQSKCVKCVKLKFKICKRTKSRRFIE